MIEYSHFIDYLKYEKRMSPHTITAYQSDLAQFSEFAGERLRVESAAEVAAKDIRTWIISLLEDESVQASSVNRKISSLRAFFRHELAAGRVEKNPTAGVIAPKNRKKLPVYVDKKDMERLFSDDLFADDYEGRRDQMILEVFYETGIRLSELINIRRLDVNLGNNTIKVMGKRSKERVIPFGNRMSELLTIYFEYYEKNVVAESENYYIFVTAKGGKLYPEAVYRIVRKYLDMVTTISKRSPHVIRHTFATHMLNNGADLNAIKAILGHSSLAATQIYTHNSVEQLKSIYKQAHPRA